MSRGPTPSSPCLADQLIGATHAEINSQPRAQGYAATWGVPLAQNARGVGIPVDYYGQCYANYPGEPKVECGIPFSKDPAPNPPSGGGVRRPRLQGPRRGVGQRRRPRQTPRLGASPRPAACRLGRRRADRLEPLGVEVLRRGRSAPRGHEVRRPGHHHRRGPPHRQRRGPGRDGAPGVLAEATGTAETVMQNVTHRRRAGHRSARPGCWCRARRLGQARRRHSSRSSTRWPPTG